MKFWRWKQTCKMNVHSAVSNPVCKVALKTKGCETLYYKGVQCFRWVQSCSICFFEIKVVPLPRIITTNTIWTMKKYLIILLMVMASLSCYADGFKAYITVTYNSISQCAVIIYGDQSATPKTKFKTFVSLLNWLSKKGWKVEPILSDKDGKSTTVLMSRENTTDQQLKTMFN